MKHLDALKLLIAPEFHRYLDEAEHLNRFDSYQEGFIAGIKSVFYMVLDSIEEVKQYELDN